MSNVDLPEDIGIDPHVSLINVTGEIRPRIRRPLTQPAHIPGCKDPPLRQ